MSDVATAKDERNRTVPGAKNTGRAKTVEQAFPEPRRHGREEWKGTSRLANTSKKRVDMVGKQPHHLEHNQTGEERKKGGCMRESVNKKHSGDPNPAQVTPKKRPKMYRYVKKFQRGQNFKQNGFGKKQPGSDLSNYRGGFFSERSEGPEKKRTRPREGKSEVKKGERAEPACPNALAAAYEEGGGPEKGRRRA